MPHILGDKTNHVIHKSESHKLHQSFAIAYESESDEDVFIGMPVKMAGDFLVEPLEAGNHRALCVGVAIHDTNKDGFNEGLPPIHSMKDTYSLRQVTVAMRSYIIIEGIAGSGGLSAGPVKFMGYTPNDDDPADEPQRFPHPGANSFLNVNPTTHWELHIGWALHDAAEDEVVRIALCI